MPTMPAELDTAVRVEHLSESDIAGYLDNDLSPDARSRIEMHLDACAECRAALIEVSELAASFRPVATSVSAGSVPPPVAAAAARQRPRRLRAVVLLALAASLTVVVLARRGTDNPTDALRSLQSSAPETRLPVAALSPEDGAVLDPAGTVFRWQAASVGLFRFVLLDETGAPVWVQETAETSITLPPEVELGSGDSYFWRVDVIADGIAASTPASRFTVAP